MSRPDTKKNITTLVKAFGENAMLRELANLVLIMVRHEPYNLNPMMKDITTLVEAFGKNAMLRELANLVIIMVCQNPRP